MKNVKIYTSNTGDGKVITTEARTFGELKNDLQANGILFNNESMKAVIGETRTTLELDGAILPETDFGLFLFPKKTKSGMAYTREECFEKVKTYRETNEGLEFFEGINVTRTSTDKLNEMIAEFENKGACREETQQVYEQEKSEILGILTKEVETLKRRLDLLIDTIIDCTYDGVYDGLSFDVKCAFDNDNMLEGEETEEEKIIPPGFEDMAAQANEIFNELS
jgi:hypothetical protein